MKKFFKFVIFCVVLFLVGLFIFLQFFLGKTIKEVVQSIDEQFLTAEVEIADLNFNILGGSVDMKGLKVNNPAGFTEDYLYKLDRSFEDLSLLALLKKQIVIENIEVKNSDLMIVRNKDGKFNFKELIKSSEKKAEAKKKDKKAEPKKEDKAVEEKEAAPMEMIPFLLENMDITAVLNFIDYKGKKEPFNIGLEIEVEAEDLGTFGDEEDKGVLTVKGHLKGDDKEFIIDVLLETEPLVDLQNPTFTLTAEVKSVDMEKLSAYQEDTGIQEGRLALKSKIVCIKGEIQKEQSVQAVQIKGLKVSEKVQKEKLKGMTPPKMLEFSFHLFGRIEKPEQDAISSFFKALINPTSLVKSQLTDKMGSQVGDKLSGTPLGGILGGEKKEEGEASESKSPLGGLMDKKESPVSKDQSGALGGLLGGEKKEESKESTVDKSPLGGLLGKKEEAKDEVKTESTPNTDVTEKKEEKISLPKGLGLKKKLF